MGVKSERAALMPREKDESEISVVLQIKARLLEQS
jgi:hypothetical protein